MQASGPIRPVEILGFDPNIPGLHDYFANVVAAVDREDDGLARDLAHSMLVAARGIGVAGGADTTNVLQAAKIEAAERATAKRLRALDVHELAKIQFKEREPLLGPFLHTQDMGMLFSPRGIGKTHLALGIAFAVATGGPFLSWEAEKPRKVLYLDGELPGHVMQQRLLMQCPVDREPEPGYLRIFTPDLPAMDGRGLPDLSTVAGQDEIDSMIEADTALVIVDNLSAWARTGRENEAESWHPVAAWMLALRRRGIAVLVVHHAGKGGEQRGTSKKEDLLDFVIKLSRPQDYDPRKGAAFVLEFTKARHLVGEAAESLEIALQGDDGGPAKWTWSTVENSTYDRVIALANDSMSQGEIATELGVNKSTVSRHLKHARDEGRLTAQPGSSK